MSGLPADVAVLGGDVDVIVRAGRVDTVGTGLSGPPGVAVLDAGGGLVVPGFVDLQCNGGFGIDLTTEPERLWELAALLPRTGVTAWLPTIVTSPPDVTERALAALARPSAEAAVAMPLGLHLEGPFLAPARRGAHGARYLSPPDHDRAAGWSADAGVALVTLAPELPGAIELVRALAARGVVVAAGHSDATAEQVRAAIEAGVSFVTHLFNAMTPWHHRSPGLAGVALTDRRVRAGVISDGRHLHPTTVAVAWRALGDRLVLVTDAVATLGTEAGSARLGDRQAVRRGGDVLLEDGTRAGSDVAMDAAVRNLAAFAGCSLGEAVAAASAAPAATLGCTDRGSLSPGARGDLVVLDPTGRVVTTVIGGEVAWRS